MFQSKFKRIFEYKAFYNALCEMLVIKLRFQRVNQRLVTSGFTRKTEIYVNYLESAPVQVIVSCHQAISDNPSHC